MTAQMVPDEKSPHFEWKQLWICSALLQTIISFLALDKSRDPGINWRKKRTCRPPRGSLGWLGWPVNFFGRSSLSNFSMYSEIKQKNPMKLTYLHSFSSLNKTVQICKGQLISINFPWLLETWSCKMPQRFFGVFQYSRNAPLYNNLKGYEFGSINVLKYTENLSKNKKSMTWH